MEIPVICPCDGALLNTEGAAVHQCPVCHRDYPVEDGVLRLLDINDEFYEGAFENRVHFVPRSERLWHVWPVWLINNGYPWAVRHHIPQGRVVVELGCAGGLSYFGQRYRMVGCDLSLSSLKKLGDEYVCRLQADATACIPLPDNSADAVVSSYFWEHIPPKQKPVLLDECHRILKPGGKLVFLYDVATDNPLIRCYKNKDPALYRQLFIEGDGHLGYQTSHENLRLFREGGFSVLAHHGMEKTWLQSASVYTKLAEYGGKMGGVYKWLQNMLGKRLLFYPYTTVLRMIDTIICPLLPGNWARIELVVCEKEIK